MTLTVQQWAGKARLLPGALVDATPPAVLAGARVLEAQAVVNVAAATGGDSRLSRVRSGKGAAIRVQTRTRGSGSSTQAEVVPTGPIMLVERPTKPHGSPRQLLATTRRRPGRGGIGGGRLNRSNVISIPGRGVYRRVRHPGTAGKYPVARAFDTAADDAGRAGAQVFVTAIRNTLT